MIERFLSSFAIDEDEIQSRKHLEMVRKKISNNEDLLDVLENFGGKSFGNGIYRTHSIDSSFKWTIFVKELFPEQEKNIWIFGYDWIGRQFGVSLHSKKELYLFDIATNEVFKVPGNGVIEFHNVELVDYYDDALAVKEYVEWKKINPANIPWDKCVGYKVPLFLGGKDTLENYELTDLEVYWEMTFQVIRQIKGLPSGTLISQIKLD